MVERRMELNARYSRKRKMKKLKAKLVAPGADREAILLKIRRVSPFWTEAALEQAKGEALAAGPERAPSDEHKRKSAPPRPKK